MTNISRDRVARTLNFRGKGQDCSSNRVGGEKRFVWAERVQHKTCGVCNSTQIIVSS